MTSLPTRDQSEDHLPHPEELRAASDRLSANPGRLDRVDGPARSRDEHRRRGPDGTALRPANA